MHAFDRRTDRNLIARPRLHSMQRGKNAHLRRATTELLKKETPEIIPLSQLWPPNSPGLNQLYYSVCEILQEKVHKTPVTDLDALTMPLTNGCCNDDGIQLGPFHSQLLFWFVRISNACFLHLLSQYFPHAVINWIQI